MRTALPHRLPMAARYQKKRLWGFAIGLSLLLLGLFLSLSVGSRSIALSEIWEVVQQPDPNNEASIIIYQLRIPRLFVGVLAGLALGASGAIMQAITRNPLAEPGLLGINAGAALAVIIGVAAFNVSHASYYMGFAFIGAGLAALAVFLLGQAHKTGVNPVRLILSGAGFSIMLASATGIIILNAPPEVFDDFRTWAAGSIEHVNPQIIAPLAITVMLGLALVLMIAKPLNALALGNELGQALGVNPKWIWFIACLATLLLAGAATASAGPIGFIGLAAPHIARLLVGPDYRWIIPYAALFAAVLLLAADVLGRVIAAPAEVAAGIIALFLGGPFFIAVARKFHMIRL